jgi:hypothetical protein
MPLLKSPVPNLVFRSIGHFQHMIKIHNCGEGPSSLLKISLSEKRKEKTKKKNSLACPSQEKNEMRQLFIFSRPKNQLAVLVL